MSFINQFYFLNKKEKRRNKHLINYILEVLKLFKIHDLFYYKRKHDAIVKL